MEQRDTAMLVVWVLLLVGIREIASAAHWTLRGSTYLSLEFLPPASGHDQSREVVSYKVKYGEDGVHTKEVILESRTQGEDWTKVQLDNLKPNTRYTFLVVPLHADRTQGPVTTFIEKTAKNDLARGSITHWTLVGPTSITLRIEPPANNRDHQRRVVGYHMEFSSKDQDVIAFFLERKSYEGNRTEITVEELVPNTDYTFRITPVNEDDTKGPVTTFVETTYNAQDGYTWDGPRNSAATTVIAVMLHVISCSAVCWEVM